MTLDLVFRGTLAASSLIAALGAFSEVGRAQVSPPPEPLAKAMWSEASAELTLPHTAPITLEGMVNAPDGSPAVGAVVVSSAGGQAVTDHDGRFSLKIQAPQGAQSLRVTAVAASSGQLVASRQISLGPGSLQPAVAPLVLAQTAGCTPGWLPTFGGQPGTNGTIRAMTVFDDGGGEALYASGSFSIAGGRPGDRVAKWDGSTWTGLGSGPVSLDSVETLAVFDDGNGTALYAGGSFTALDDVPANRVAKWNGTTWAPVGSGMNDRVEVLLEFDDGTGSALYAGGWFTNAGGVSASHIARWNGSNWAAVGGGMDDDVLALTPFDDGNGSGLYAAGRFVMADGIPANRIAKWNGSNWTSLGSGADWRIDALITFDDGGGLALYAGGGFQSAGGIPATGVAKWDGASWSAVSGGLALDTVSTLAVFDDGSGPALYAADLFGGQSTYFVTKWDGASWSIFAGGMNGLILSLQVFDDGSGPSLFAGGSFTVAAGQPALNIASWNGTSWKALGGGLTDEVRALAVFDDGQGPALYVAGDFPKAGGVLVNQIARWNGTTWTDLDSGITNFSGSSGSILALAVFDDGTGEALYAAGAFLGMGNVSARRIAKWDGSTWASLGTPSSNGLNLSVTALAVHDDGSGMALFAGGFFTEAAGVTANGMAKWNGSDWSDVDGGMSGFNPNVLAMAVFDDGGGPDLYVGGRFTGAGSAAANYVARWDGTSWSTLGSGTDTFVHALTTFDDGSGTALYVGGFITAAGGVPVNRIAKWSGTAWSALGSGMSMALSNATVDALQVFDDGSGLALYAGGLFDSAGGVAANRIAKWNGTQWSPLGSGLSIGFSGRVNTLLAFDDGGGSALFAGGSFGATPDSGDSFLAKWGCSAVETFESFCNGDGGDQAGCTDCPCGNNAPMGTIGGCLNSVSSSAQLQAGGVPSVASDTMRINLTGGTASTFAILSSGASRAPANAVNPCFGLDTGIQSPTFDGLRCAVQSVLRHGTRQTDSNGDVGVTTNGWGGIFGPPGGLIAQGGFVAGQTRHYQVVYREEVTLGCMRGLNTSQGISVTFEP